MHCVAIGIVRELLPLTVKYVSSEYNQFYANDVSVLFIFMLLF